MILALKIFIGLASTYVVFSYHFAYRLLDTNYGAKMIEATRLKAPNASEEMRRTMIILSAPYWFPIALKVRRHQKIAINLLELNIKMLKDSKERMKGYLSTLTDSEAIETANDFIRGRSEQIKEMETRLEEVKNEM